MKGLAFLYLASCAVFLIFSPNVAEGRLMFYAQEATDVGHVYRQGSSAKFTCQDMDSIKSYDISWSFRNATFYRILTTNRKLAPDVESAKYKLHSQATILEIVDLTVPDSGNYTCSVTDENGETVLSATAVVIVKAGNLAEHAGNATSPFLQTTSIPLGIVSHSLRPSPTISPLLPIMTPSNLIPLTSSGVSAVRAKPSWPTPLPPSCGNSSSSTDMSFIKEENSPDLMTVTEGQLVKLHCSYCPLGSDPVYLSWYKEGRQITVNTQHTSHGGTLTLPGVLQHKDEGLYQCLIQARSTRNISTFITVIVHKVDSNSLLSSISALNTTSTSVKVRWRLTEHGLFIVTHVTLRLRPLNSSTWTHHVDNISQGKGSFVFGQLQPANVYVLNVSLYSNSKCLDSRSVVFWTAAFNTTVFEENPKLLFQVTNRRALGVALGIIGVLAVVVVTYACVMWCRDDKRGYTVPPGHKHSRDMNKENQTLHGPTNMYYNRAFMDDESAWRGDQL